MRKILATLWIVIIASVVFITFHFSKPKSAQLENQLPVTTTLDTKISRGQAIATNGNYEKTGDEFLNKDDLENAIANYQKALTVKPSDTDLMLKLGDTYLKNNQTDEARDLFTEAVKLKPDSIDVNIALARTYLGMRQIENAKKIIWNLDDKNPRAQYYKGIIAILYKNFAGAKTIFEDISKLNPKPEQSLIDNNQKFLDAYQNFSYYKGSENTYLELLLAKAMTSTNEYQAAIPLLYDILNTKNNYRDAWIVLGYAYLNINKPNDAVDALIQAKDLTPEKPETLFYLGLAYFAKDDLDKAIYYIEKADKQGYEPKDQINLKLGDLYLLKKDYQKSSDHYSNVVSTNTKNMDIFVRTVWLNIEQLNKPDAALALSKKALETHPNDAMSYNLLGWSYTALGNFADAKKNLDTAISMQPNLDATNLNYGWLSEKSGDNNQAKAYYKKAYALGRGNSISKLAATRYNSLNQNGPIPR
ncbi:MAG: tetratricopeptide repeat protein [Candidatus Peregrinibacteria bacterium]|nr:tetratricopeptide repeat protein [Candidatus Peregrinibacteria bacterium]